MTNDNDLIRRAALQDAGYDTVAVAASQPANPVINADSRQRVTVKPLVWEEQDGKSYRQANCVLGQYQVRFLCEFECWQLSRFVRSGQVWKETFSRHSNKDAAKAAAQADYEARILAALEPHPDPRDEVIAEAEARGMQRAAEICKSAWIQTPEPLTARDCYDAILAAIPKGGDA